MKVLYCLDIPQLFDVVQFYRPPSYGCREYAATQLHVDCGNEFSTNWSCIQTDEGNSFFCPRCGQKLRRGAASRGRFRQTCRGEIIPTSMQLRVTEYAHYVDLEIRYRAVKTEPTEAVLKLHKLPNMIKYTIRADIKQQLVLLSSRTHLRFTDLNFKNLAANPVSDMDWAMHTPLRYLASDSYADKHLVELRKLFKAFRQAVERKLIRKLGYDVPSMYVGTSLHSRIGAHGYGVFYNALSNLAWRLAAPTAPNCDRRAAYDCNLYRGADVLATYREVLQYTRIGMHYTAAVCKAFELPDKPVVRKVLRETPLFNDVYVAQAAQLTTDVNHIPTLTAALRRFTGGLRPEQLTFFKIIAHKRGVRSLIAWLQRDAVEIIDAADTYRKLTPRYRLQLWTGTWKMRDLHDTLVQLYDYQQYPNLQIDTTKSALLQGVVGGYSFYTPSETHQLNVIGKALHNCVKTYADKAVAQECVIIGVRQGSKIIACIELQNNKVVQAKREYNRPVYGDVRLCAAVLNWAQQHNLRVKTDDLRPATQRAV